MRRLSLLLRFLIATLTLLPVDAADCCGRGVAVVESISGQVSALGPGARARRPLLNLEWLEEGVTVAPSTGARAIIILADGHRYEARGGVQAKIMAGSITAIRGTVHELEPLPPLPAAAPIADNQAFTAGAIRLRGVPEIHNLYPRQGVFTLPASVSLTFSKVAEATNYRIKLSDEDGESLAIWETTATEFPIPEGIVEAGSRYNWRVQGIAGGAVVAEGRASFATVSEQDLQRRADFGRAIRAMASESLQSALLADLDFHLGLLQQARDGFQAALRLNRGDPGVQHGLELVEAALTEKPEK